MKNNRSRRSFLQQCATSALVLTGAQRFSENAMAIEPIQRNGAPKFKFSLAAYSYRNLLTGNPPELTLYDFIEDCAAMGLEGTELTSYYFPASPTDDYLRDIKQKCFQLGLDISGTAIGNDFGFEPGPERDQQLAMTKQWIDRAEILGAPVIRIFAGKQKRGIEPKKSYALMVEGIEECCDYAGQHGVHLALENHGGPTATVEGMLAFINDVKSPWFGVNLDTGNFYTEDPYLDLAQIAPYSLNVQVKVVTTDEARENKRPTDFRRLAKILRDSNYRGYVALEYEESDDPREVCPKYLDIVREAFA